MTSVSSELEAQQALLGLKSQRRTTYCRRMPTAIDALVMVLGPATQLPYLITWATIICQNPALKQHITVVLQQVLFSQAFAGIIMLSVGQLAGTPNIDPLAAIFFGRMAEKVVQVLDTDGIEDTLYMPHVLLMMAFTSACYGLTTLLIGRFNLAFALRFLPYTVVGGYLAAMGIVFGQSAMKLALDGDPVTMLITLSPDVWAQAGCVVICALFIGFLRSVHPLCTPLSLIIPPLICFWTRKITGMPGDSWFMQVDIHGHFDWYSVWTVEARGMSSFYSPAFFNYEFVSELLNFVAIITFSWLFNVAGTSKISVKLNKEYDEDKEVCALGTWNLSTAVCGGTLLCHSISLPIMTQAIGCTTAWPMVLALANVLLFLFSKYCLLVLAYVPRFVFASVVFRVCMDVLWDWVVQSRKKIASREWQMLLVTAVLTSQHFGAGIVLGLVMALASFAFEYAAIVGVRRQGTLVDFRSSVQRPPEEERCIKAQGASVQVFLVNGYLFWGSVSQVINEVLSCVSRGSNGVILDLALVPAMDANGVQAIVGLLGGLLNQPCGMPTDAPMSRQTSGDSVDRELSRKRRPVPVALCGLVRRLRMALENELKNQGLPSDAFKKFVTLDEALEWVEESILSGPYDKNESARPSWKVARSPENQWSSREGLNDLADDASSPGRQRSHTWDSMQRHGAFSAEDVWMDLLGAERLNRMDPTRVVLGLLSSATQRRRLQPGSSLFRRGEVARSVFYLADGRVDVMEMVSENSRKLPRLARHHLNTTKGDVFSFEGLRQRRVLRAHEGHVFGAMEYAAAQASDLDEPTWPLHEQSATVAEEAIIFSIDSDQLWSYEKESIPLAALLRGWLARLALDAKVGDKATYSRQASETLL